MELVKNICWPGVKLLALLEVLSGERLPMERGRVLRRPHYLSNINTALEFLRGKRVSAEQCNNIYHKVHKVHELHT